MPREFDRAARIGGQIRREMAELLRTHATDPRMLSVTVVEVEVARNLAHARVYVQLPPGEPEEQAETMQLLDEAVPPLRARLAGRMRTKKVPALKFEQDRSPELAARLEELLADTPRSEEEEGGGRP